jgi:LEA14-like dessication related protein
MSSKRFLQTARLVSASPAARGAIIVALCLFAFAASAAAQSRMPGDDYTDKLVSVNVREVILEAIDFRDQTARMSITLDVKNPLPLKLKDFDYRLRLYGLEAITGDYDGEMKLGGKRPLRINLPVRLNLRAIPQIVWSAFRNGGQLKFDLDTAFTLPLFVIEKRFDKKFSGEVPLKSLVDAATLLRASKLGF